MDIKIKQARMDFADLWEPDDKFKRYNLTLLIEPGSENDKAIEAAIAAEGKAVLGAKAPALLKAFASQKNQYCYFPASANPEYEYREGFKVLGCHSKTRPTFVLDRLKNPLAADSGKPYRGCVVNATVSIYVQGSTADYPGVRCSFNGVQFWKDGDAFGGAKPASLGDFEMSDGADAEDLV